MSQVLIGIIGVLLFIGLAIAGAMYLGDRFKEANNNSKASAAVQGMAQVANATSMHNLQTGVSAAPTATLTGSTVYTGGYLKAAPANPVITANAPLLGDSAGAIPGTGDAKYSLMNLGAGTTADAVCLAIARQTGQAPAATTVVSAAAIPAGTAGCIKLTAAITGAGAIGDALAYTAI